MGLLSDDKTRSKIVTGIRNYNNKVAFICYFAGLIWFLSLAYNPFNAKTYFSENALIPGLVESTFYTDHGSEKYYEELKEEFRVRKEYVDNMTEHKRDESLLYSLPTSWLETRMRAIGLETYVHNYSFTYPMEIAKGQKFFGHNVYGVLRAPKAASTEAVVLSVPFRSMHADGEKTAAGVALMLGLAKAFRSKTYWAKDIIFLVTEHDNIGMQAWLGAYHYYKLEYIYPSELPSRSGSIQAAINLELGNDQISRVNLKLEGLNGQLPNLDLVNTVIRLSKQHGITPVLHKRKDHWMFDGIDSWQHSVKTMLMMMLHQASGFPTGNHGLFHRYHIEAVTLQGIKIKSAKKNAGFVEVGRMIEGIFRSLNNLMERFHQSFFFYLLPATERYVSIGLYMPPFGVLALPILIKAVALWIDFRYDYDQAIAAKNNKKKQGSALNIGEGDEETKDSDSIAPEEKNVSGYASVFPSILMSFVFGLGTCYIPPFFIDTAVALNMGPADGLLMGVLALFLASMAYPKMLSRKAAKRGIIEGPNWKLLKCLGLLLLGIVLGATAMLNISLAFFVAAMWSPVVVAIKPRKSKILTGIQGILLVLISPLGLAYIGGLVHYFMQSGFSSAMSVMQVHSKAWENLQHGVLMAVVDSYFYSNWLYVLVTLLFWPCWLILWAVIFAPLE